MAQFAVPLMIGGTLLQAYGTYKAGKESRALHEQRAGALEEQARAGERAGLEEQALLTEEKYRTVGAQKTAYAKAGVRVGGGGLRTSDVVVAADTIAQIERDKAVIGAETVRQASYTRQRAGWERKIGKSKERAGRYGAVASLLSGGAQIGTHYWQKSLLSKKYPLS